MMPGIPEALEDKPSHGHLLFVGAGTDSQSPTLFRTSTQGTQSESLDWPGPPRASPRSNELWELEQNVNSKLSTLTEEVQKSQLESGERFWTLHEQVKKVSEQISEFQRTLGGGLHPSCVKVLQEVVEQSRSFTMLSQESLGSEEDGDGPNAIHYSLASHAGQKHCFVHGSMSQPCLPVLDEPVEVRSAEQGRSPERASTLDNVPSLWGEVQGHSPQRPSTVGHLPSVSVQVENQHTLSVDHVEVTNCSPYGPHASCVKGDCPDTSHSFLPSRAGDKRGVMTLPCLPVLQEPAEEQTADHDRRPKLPSTLGELPSLSKGKKIARSRAAVLDKIKRASRASPLSSLWDAHRASYEALPSMDLEKPSESYLPGQPYKEDETGPGAGPPHNVDSVEISVYDASETLAPKSDPRPQIFGVQSVLPGDIQGVRGREMQSRELFCRDMVEQQRERAGAHDPGSLLGKSCGWQGCLFPGSFMVSLQARFRATGNGVVVLLTYLSGQDSSTSRCWICRTTVVALATSASLATCLPVESGHSFHPECMSSTKSGVALRLGALSSLLVWAMLRRSQRRSCRENIMEALCQTGLDYDFEATSRWDAACACIYWILILALKLSLPALEGNRCAPHTHLEEAVSTAGFMVSASVLVSAIFAFTQILRMLELVIKDFPDWVVRNSDLPEAMNQWRVRHDTIRGTCWAYEYQSCSLLIVLVVIGAFVLVEFSDQASTRPLPEAMIACSLLFVTWQAASVTQACRRITAILSTAPFSEDIPADRMSILMDHIDKSEAGFYILGTRLSPELVFKVINAAAVITFAFMTRFSPLFKKT